jgi:hypothetical protein
VAEWPGCQVIWAAAMNVTITSATTSGARLGR